MVTVVPVPAVVGKNELTVVTNAMYFVLLVLDEFLLNAKTFGSALLIYRNGCKGKT